MAASIRNVRVLQRVRHITPGFIGGWRVWGQQCRLCSTSPAPDVDDQDLPPDRKFSHDAESLAARGYLRTQKPYSPPHNAATQVQEICKKVLQSSDSKAAFSDVQTKFQVLTMCSAAFGHSVPNSLLHKVTNVGDLVKFYQTEVDTTVPLDRFKSQDLPKNLHVTYNYTRFHPETDTMFGGVSAFTKDSNIVSSIKAKKKYPGYKAPSQWPYK